jgi:hypothetical protein
MINKIAKAIAFTGCKIVNVKPTKENIMFNYIKSMFAKDELVQIATKKRTVENRGRKSLSKKQKVLNLLSKGSNVSWKSLRNKFDLTSPRAMVDTLRAEGYMVYGSKVKGETVYRLGTPTRAIIAAGIQKLYGTPFKYDNHVVKMPKKSELSSIDA